MRESSQFLHIQRKKHLPNQSKYYTTYAFIFFQLIYIYISYMPKMEREYYFLKCCLNKFLSSTQFYNHKKRLFCIILQTLKIKSQLFCTHTAYDSKTGSQHKDLTSYKRLGSSGGIKIPTRLVGFFNLAVTQSQIYFAPVVVVYISTYHYI